MQGEVKPLLDRLNLERLDRDLYRGYSPDDGRARVFGGQVAAQALVAAVRTVSDRHVHSLHAFFLRPGDPKIPIIYEVDRIRDGRSFVTRRVVAIQEGCAIFNMAASFQKEEAGHEHQVPMPSVPPPESVVSNDERVDRLAEEDPIFQWFRHQEQPLLIHDLDPQDPRTPVARPGAHHVWFRARGALPDDPLLHQCVLTYASDCTLLDASLRQHGLSWFDSKFIGASLDHAMWFHRPFRADEWLLYSTESLSTANARGLNLGRIFDRSGVLVATVAQEGLMRLVGYSA